MAQQTHRHWLWNIIIEGYILVWPRLYWLKEMLLSLLIFFLKASQYFAARVPPVEKNNDAGAGRQRKLQEKKIKEEKLEKFNERKLSYSGVHWLPVQVSTGNYLTIQVFFFMEFSHWIHACVLAGAAMLLRALAKGWRGNLRAVLFLQRNEMSWKQKPSHARLRRTRQGKAASPWTVAERNYKYKNMRKRCAAHRLEHFFLWGQVCKSPIPIGLMD